MRWRRRRGRGQNAFEFSALAGLKLVQTAVLRQLPSQKQVVSLQEACDSVLPGGRGNGVFDLHARCTHTAVRELHVELPLHAAGYLLRSDVAEGLVHQHQRAAGKDVSQPACKQLFVHTSKHDC